MQESHLPWLEAMGWDGELGRASKGREGLSHGFCVCDLCLHLLRWVCGALQGADLEMEEIQVELGAEMWSIQAASILLCPEGPCNLGQALSFLCV